MLTLQKLQIQSFLFRKANLKYVGNRRCSFLPEERSGSFRCSPLLAPVPRGKTERRVSFVRENANTQGKVFSNPIGLAAGYDKDGTAIFSLMVMGFGV